MYDEDIIEERVDKLETILGEFIAQTNFSINNLSKEMIAFKNETDFSINNLSKEMAGFKDEMADFKNEMRNDKREMNRQWGNLANKMGTLVEDIVSPAVGPVIKKYFKVDISMITTRIRRKDKALKLSGEYDVLCIADDYVFLVETKSNPCEANLNDFLQNIEKFKKLFPQYANKKIIPIFASLVFENDLIEKASSKNIYILAYREFDYMDILNFNEISF